MDFGSNKMRVEVIRKGAFGWIYFSDIYSSVTGKWQEFDQSKDLDQKYYCSSYYVSVKNMVLNVEHR